MSRRRGLGTALAVGIALAGGVTNRTLASFVGITYQTAVVGGLNRCRVFAQFNSPNDVVLNVFGILNFGNSTWHHDDFVGGSWNPQLTINPETDTFVTIGGTPDFTNSTAADPGWGGAGFNQPGIPNGAGWFNSNPPNLQGQADPVTFKVLISQFVWSAPPGAFASPVTIGFNQGIGTPTSFAQSTFAVCIPAPGAALAIALVCAGRGRARQPSMRDRR